MDKPLYRFRPPYVDIINYEFDMSITRRIPSDFAYKYNIVAIDSFGKLLTVAMTNPEAPDVIEKLENMTCSKVLPIRCCAKQLKKVLKKVYTST